MSEITKNVSIRQNFDETSENLLNQLINLIMFGNYTYHSIAYFFDRVDIGLVGVADLYRHCALDSYGLSRKCMDYIVLRGGEVKFDDLKKPEKNDWGTTLEAIEYLLNLKMLTNELAIKVHKNAIENHDPHLTDFLENEILQPTAVFIRKVGIIITNLRRAGPELGEYQFNKHLKCYLDEVVVTDSQLVHFKSFQDFYSF